MPVRITLVFTKAGEALQFFREVMTGKTWENEIEVHIEGDLEEFHELMTQATIDSMLVNVEEFLDEQNGSETNDS